MNSQDRIIIQALINRVTLESKAQIIQLSDYGPVMFRNIYNEAMIAQITITIIEPGKTFQIGL